MSRSSVYCSDFIHLTAFSRYISIAVMGCWIKVVTLCDTPWPCLSLPTFIFMPWWPFVPSSLHPSPSVDKNKPVCLELCSRCGLWSMCTWLPIYGHHVEWHNPPSLSQCILHAPSYTFSAGLKGSMYIFTRWGFLSHACMPLNLLQQLPSRKHTSRFTQHYSTSDHPTSATATRASSESQHTTHSNAPVFQTSKVWIS